MTVIRTVNEISLIVEDSICAFFYKLQRHLTDKIDCYFSGTTITCSILLKSKHILYAINIGDSRQILFSSLNKQLPNTENTPQINIKSLTVDHTCNNLSEKRRIEQKGGIIIQDSVDKDMFRVYKGTLPYQGIVPTRSLGDLAAHSCGIISTPEIKVYHLSPNNTGNNNLYVLVLESDGVSDVLSDQKLASLIINSFHLPLNEITEKVVLKAYKYSQLKGFADNLTLGIVVIKF